MSAATHSAIPAGAIGDPPNPNGLVWSLLVAGADDQPEWEWRHYDLVHTQSHHSIGHEPSLPEFARAVLLGSDETARILEQDGVVAGALPSYARTGDAREFTVTVWHFALTREFLFTARRTAARALVHAWDAVQRGEPLSGPAELVDRCIIDFAREARKHLAGLAESLNPLEDALFDARDSSSLAEFAGNLGVVRREATRLKRVLIPLARTLDDENDDLHEWALISEHQVSLRLVHGALDDIAALADRARSLQDELTARLAEETNRRLYIVSVVTTLVMPATFITGFFGMNTGGLLWGGDGAPLGTFYAALLCFLAVLGTLALLRWKRLL